MFLAIVFATLRFIRVSVSTLRGLNRLPGVVLQQLSPSGHPDAGESLGLPPWGSWPKHSSTWFLPGRPSVSSAEVF